MKELEPSSPPETAAARGAADEQGTKRQQATMYNREELQQIQPLLVELFHLLKDPSTGKADRDALAFALYANGCIYESKKELIMEIVDKDHPQGLYDLPTFTDILVSELASRPIGEETERMFQLFTRYADEGDESHIVSVPRQKDDVIRPEDLKRITRVLGRPLPLAELDDMVKEFSVTGKGVNFAEWAAIVGRGRK